MKRLVLCLLALATAACEPKAKPSEPKVERPAVQQSPMQRDLDRICNAEELSGALDLEPGARALHVGAWLATNIESQEARDLSAAMVKLGPEERSSRLQQELDKHDMGKCEILHAWRAP